MIRDGFEEEDKENPNHACIEVIKEVKIKTPELERLYHKIMNF